MLDASVAIKWFLPESGNARAENILTAFLIGSVRLYAADLLLIEAASALWRRSVVLKELTPSDAKAIYRDLLTLPLNFQPSGAPGRIRLLTGDCTSPFGVRFRLLRSRSRDGLRIDHCGPEPCVEVGAGAAVHSAYLDD